MCWNCCGNEVFEMTDYLPAHVCSACFDTLRGSDTGESTANASRPVSSPAARQLVEYGYASQGPGLPIGMDIRLDRVQLALTLDVTSTPREPVATPRVATQRAVEAGLGMAALAATGFSLSTASVADGRSSIRIAADTLTLEDCRAQAQHRPSHHRQLVRRCQVDTASSAPQVEYTISRPTVGSIDYELVVRDSVIAVCADAVVDLVRYLGPPTAEPASVHEGSPAMERDDRHAPRRESAFVAHPSSTFATILQTSTVALVQIPSARESPAVVVSGAVTAVVATERDKELRLNSDIFGRAEDLRCDVVWQHLAASGSPVVAAEPPWPGHKEVVLEPATVQWRSQWDHVSGSSVPKQANHSSVAGDSKEDVGITDESIVLWRQSEVQVTRIAASVGYSHFYVLTSVADAATAMVENLTEGGASQPRDSQVGHSSEGDTVAVDSLTVQCHEVRAVFLDDASQERVEPVAAIYLANIHAGVKHRPDGAVLTAEFSVHVQRYVGKWLWRLAVALKVALLVRYNPRRESMDELLHPWYFALTVTRRHNEGNAATAAATNVSLRAINTFHMDVPDAFVVRVAELVGMWGAKHPRIGEVWACSGADVEPSQAGGDAEAAASHGPEAHPTMTMSVMLPALVLQLLTDSLVVRKPLATVGAPPAPTLRVVAQLRDAMSVAWTGIR